MITKPTLFILGAGASIPYGFPSGAALRNKICAEASTDASILASAMRKYFGISDSDFMEFAEAFKHSRLASIDSFLSRRTEYSEIGKLVIASLLVPCEKDEIFNHNIEDDWYFAFWNALVANIGSLEELKQNNVQIYTFNYDRSLERYLHIAIINTFNVDSEEALQALSCFNIHHVYGSLGLFGIQHNYSKNIRAYTSEFNQHAIELAAAGLRVIPEARAEDAIFSKAQDAFKWADNVCFLGFGFDALNIQRLGFKSISESRNGTHVKMTKNVVTSSFGKTNSEMEIAHNSLFENYNYDTVPVWDFVPTLKNLDTLRNHAWLLS